MLLLDVATTEASFCEGTVTIWRLLGYVVLVIKIVIPIILIVLGMLDLGKAVVSNDDKAINKSVTTLTKRFVAAIIIFFIPSLVNTVFNILVGINLGNSASTCVTCLTKPGEAICKNTNDPFDLTGN